MPCDISVIGLEDMFTIFGLILKKKTSVMNFFLVESYSQD